MDDAPSSDKFSAFQACGDATAHVDRILDIIRRIRLFDDFERPDIEKLARYVRCYRADAGAAIIREGDEGDFMVLLIEGSAEILKTDPQGLPRRMAVDGPGKTLGEMSLIDGELRFASCVTLEPTLFAVLDRAALTRVIAEEPGVGIKLLMELLMLLNQRLRTVSGELIRCIESQRQQIR